MPIGRDEESTIELIRDPEPKAAERPARPKKGAKKKPPKKTKPRK